MYKSIFSTHLFYEIKNATNIYEKLANCSCIALPTAIHGLVGAPCCVIVFVKGIAINCKRCLAEHAEIVHKYSSNYGF